jgi:hypothetical protein
METSFAEGLVLPVAGTLLAIYLVVRLAIRHERRNHPDR